MMKTAIFAAGLACGCALGSTLTAEQRRKLAEPVRRLAGSSATHRLGDSVRHVADTAAELAASKVDGLATAIQPQRERRRSHAERPIDGLDDLTANRRSDAGTAASPPRTRSLRGAPTIFDGST